MCRIEHAGDVLSKDGKRKLGNLFVESEFDLTNLKKHMSGKKVIGRILSVTLKSWLLLCR